jgi:hypothetical protein
VKNVVRRNYAFLNLHRSLAADQSRIRGGHWPQRNRAQKNVPEGTVLARAKREGWTQQIEAAKQAAALTQSNAITPLQSIAAVMQERGERYRERVAGVSERVVGHVESMDPDEILARSGQFEKIDTIARRTFGLNNAPSGQGCLSLNILTNHSLVQVKATLPAAPSSPTVARSLARQC